MKSFKHIPAAIAALISWQFAFATPSVDESLLTYLQQQLSEVQAEKQELLNDLEPGAFFKSRLHITSATRDQFLAKEQSMKAHMRAIRSYLQRAVSMFRVTENSISANQLSSYRQLTLQFNRTLDEAKAMSVVDDGANYLGGFGGPRQLLEKNEIENLVLTPFDFTQGFAFMCGESWGSGLILYRNPQTGQIQYSSSWKSGIAIVSFKPDGSANIQSSWKSGLSSAFNAQSNTWTLTNGGWKTPTASVYNPVTGRIEVESGGRRTGIAGVFNPLSQKVEWNTEWSSGVAGYFDSNQRKVIWKTSWKSGVACIWRDQSGNYDMSYGFFGGEVDDDD